ncbi:hypothetical protein ABZ370_43600 [Streptomyces sp. NPDC005962]|uniref:hypothetical protein n=1 Tax=Streptomyces sp. NPDC005962 TaxID=3154466 RepID=UPI0034093B5C
MSSTVASRHSPEIVSVALRTLTQVAEELRAEAPVGGNSLEGLLARVRSRFPDMRLGTPTYVEVEEALKHAGFPLTYDTETDRFRPPARPAVSGTSRLTGTRMSHQLSRLGQPERRDGWCRRP